MMSVRNIVRFVGIAVALLVHSGAFSATQPPAGTLLFSPLYLKDSAGSKLENATFNYQGHLYELRLHGLGVGGAMGVSVTVSGEVYGLNNLADLEDRFVPETADDASTEISSQDLWLYSERGVSIRLETDQPEVAMAPGGDEVSIELVKVE